MDMNIRRAAALGCLQTLVSGILEFYELPDNVRKLLEYGIRQAEGYLDGEGIEEKEKGFQVKAI